MPAWEKGVTEYYENFEGFASLTFVPPICILAHMDEFGKDRRGVTLIGEILLQLAQRENIRRRLADLEARGGPDLVRQLLDEFERIVDNRYLEAMKAEPPLEPAKPTMELPEAPPSPVIPESTPPPPTPHPIETERRLPFASIFTVELPETARPPRAPEQQPTGALPPVRKPVEPKREQPVRASVAPPSEVVPEPPLRRATPPEPEKPIIPPVRKPVETKVGEPIRSSVSPPPKVVPEPSFPRPAPPGPRAPLVALPRSPERPVSDERPKMPPELPVEPSAGASDVHYDVNPNAPGKGAHPRNSYELADDDMIYLHAVAQIPLEEKPAHVPFMLEEKGIENRNFAFALDRGGLRFYLSRIAGRSMNVSKTGVLLLNKQESIRIRGVHFGILNDLRAHGVLLPFTFGTVARGKEDLYSKIDDHIYEIRDALDEVLSTKWWDLNVYVLDYTMAQMLAPDGVPARRERERRTMGSRPTPTVGRIDIKALERVLGKQKKIAESIHEQLKELAVRSDVDMIVDLNSGSSEDWKIILKASYEVPLTGIHRFNRLVTDLQYHHVQYEMMFVLNGDCAEYSFREV